MGESVHFTSSRGEACGYLARPAGAAVPVSAGAAPRAGIVVIQEWWGLVPQIEGVADRFAAAAGYVALAPDLYHGQSTVEAEEAHHLMEGLDWARAAAELAGAVAHLREAEGVSRVGVVGFCMGGALTLIAAADPAVAAWVSFYGFPPAGSAELDRITAPGLQIFGEHEHAFSVAEAEAFAVAQRAKGLEAGFVVYPGAGHGFFNETIPAIYHEPSAQDAWARTVEHFGRHLHG